MHHLFSDYIIDAHTRYEAHSLIYTPEGEESLVLRGILAAAVFSALVVDTEEGDRRELALDTDAQREAWFESYEREMRRDNGGLFITEVHALSEAYMELNGDMNLLLSICGNDRLYDLAVGLAVEYMQRLVREEVREQIYDLVPWTGPFAQWLFNAGFVETRRQHLLSINWTDPAAVYAFSEELKNFQSPISNLQSEQPLFVFEGLSAEKVLNGYWEWLWGEAQKEANLFPDAKVQLAQIRQIILKEETDFEFIKPEMKSFTQPQINLFRKWMSLWKDFVEQKITPAPNVGKKKDFRQEIFLDDVMSVPPAHDYVKVREYILERCRYDQEFKKYFRAHRMTEMCRQLTFLFGWEVDDNALGKRMRSKAKK